MRSVWPILALGALGATPGDAPAQIPLNAGPPTAASEAPTVGGTSTIDLVILREGLPSVPLRFGGVVAGSERVELDGIRLVRGVDYQIDNAAGVIYLIRAHRPGQSLIASYRHDGKLEAKTPGQAFGLGTMRFDLVPKSVGVVLGLGMTERQADGNVLTSNVYGLNNEFAIGSGTLKGLYLAGSRERAQASSLFEFSQPGAPKEIGRSSLMLQEFAAKVGGGLIEAAYQNVSKNFSAFSAVQSAGVDEGRVQQLQKERGLSRLNFNVKDVGIGGLKFGQTYKTIGEGGDSIDWRSFSLGFGGFTAFYQSQEVDAGFTRFKDIAEGDRAQLQKEAGMARKSYGLNYQASGTKLSFLSSGIFDPDHHAIRKQEWDVQAGAFRLKSGNQAVDQAFSRVNSLTDPEKNVLAREVGTSRRWLDVGWVSGKNGEGLNYAQSSLRSSSGEFQAQDVSVAAKNFKVEHLEREADAGFASFGAMQDAERAAHVKAISLMYDPAGIAAKPQDLNAFMQGGGISRSLTRLSLEPRPGWKFSADRLGVASEQGRVSVDTVNFSAGLFSLAFRKQNASGDDWNLGSLMEFERLRLGNLAGLDKTDLSASLKFGKSGVLNVGTMTASTPEGGASRQSFSLKTNAIDVNYAVREVAEGFGGVGQLVDPEKALLQSLRGFRQSDLKAKWQILPRLALDVSCFDADSDALNQQRYYRNYSLNWNPDKDTQISLLRLERRDDDPFQLLFGNTVDFMNLTHSFGRFGTLRYLSESKTYDGTQAMQPDSERRTLTYEAKINEKTSFKTEQTSTVFEDGGKENISSHSLSTAVGSRMGVSVSQVSVDRDGDAKDELKRLLGFWFDFGGGIRLTYGVDSFDATDTGKNTANTQIGLGSGNIGNLNLGQAGYSGQYVEGQGSKTASNVQLSTRKPFRLGFLDDLQLSASIQTKSDQDRWIQEDKNFRLLGKIGSNAFAVEYRGQMHSSGHRAIDRGYMFTTDQSEKNRLRATIKYKIRTMPWDEQIMIRDFALAWKPAKDIELTHQLVTNPTVDRADALLGSVVQAKAINRWKLDYKSQGDIRIGGQWEEIIDQNRPRLRTAGVNLTLNANNPSPVALYYGLEQSDAATGRKTTHRYHLRYDQRPGPNQMFSLFLGNVSYQHSIVDGQHRNNWTIRLDYQLRF